MNTPRSSSIKPASSPTRNGAPAPAAIPVQAPAASSELTELLDDLTSAEAAERAPRSLQAAQRRPHGAD